MSFNIILQRNKSDKNHLTKDLTNIATVSGILKSETSIIDPVVLIEGDISSYTACNYATISTFGRSYYINNIRSIRNGLFAIECHVDVLQSFASQIRANTGIIRKQENVWNLYLNDGSFKVYQNPIVLTKPFPNGFTSTEFILAVAGA